MNVFSCLETAASGSPSNQGPGQANRPDRQAQNASPQPGALGGIPSGQGPRRASFSANSTPVVLAPPAQMRSEISSPAQRQTGMANPPLPPAPAQGGQIEALHTALQRNPNVGQQFNARSNGLVQENQLLAPGLVASPMAQPSILQPAFQHNLVPVMLQPVPQQNPGQVASGGRRTLAQKCASHQRPIACGAISGAMLGGLMGVEGGTSSAVGGCIGGGISGSLIALVISAAYRCISRRNPHPPQAPLAVFAGNAQV